MCIADSIIYSGVKGKNIIIDKQQGTKFEIWNDGYFPKPYNKSSLLQMINKHFNNMVNKQHFPVNHINEMIERGWRS